MKTDELLDILKIKEIYEKNKVFLPWSISYTDRLLGTNNSARFFFNEDDTIYIVVETEEFSKNIQQIKLGLILNNNEVYLNKNEIFLNEPLKFLNFQEDLENSLKFLSNYIYNILIPKFQLKSNITQLY